MLYAALAMIPVTLFIIWLYTRDRLHPEPKRAVYRLFLRGAAIVLPAGLIERLLLSSWSEARLGGWPALLITAFFIAGMVEEFLKASIVDRGAIENGLVRSPIDCVVYSGATALGFAAVETILYVTSSGFFTVILRSVTAVPAHMMFGILMGAAFAESVWGTRSRGWAYIVPAFAHGVYDTFALAGGVLPDLFLAAYLVVLLEWSLRRIRQMDRWSVQRVS
ncbi:PrsW family intramembrane metalloprotease [Alicyclobacillus kakegawensis]|uniref:PrsW family intramembrane metalloprotease n=1 Tax=Alicyclobacillus kakegawensis TaxID=392012 RepID=UPI000A67301A|nr:PrsW family glutamic-type intramembrane protease [Alicyclobacillus kakegawensis]